jgi:hypothetical protein
VVVGVIAMFRQPQNKKLRHSARHTPEICRDKDVLKARLIRLGRTHLLPPFVGWQGTAGANND